MGPPYHKNFAGTVEDKTRERQILAILEKPFAASKRSSRLELGRRLVDWYRRLCASFAFPTEVLDPDLVDLFALWVGRGKAEAALRMTALEELMEQLEWEAPNPERGLQLLNSWVTTKMAGEDQVFHDRYQAALVTMRDRLSEIRRREKDTGTKLLFH